MMFWRVHLSNRRLYRLEIFSVLGAPLLAAWSHPNRVSYFELDSGAALGERHLDILDSDVRNFEDWQALLPQLAAPNGAYPAVVANDRWTVHLDQTGQFRFYYADEAYIAIGPSETKLEIGAIRAVGLDRPLGLLALLDATGKLHLYQQNIRLFQFDIGLQPDPAARSGLAVMEGGRAICVAYNRQLIRFDSQGQRLDHLALHYDIGQFACSPDGRYLACGDLETNVIRIYDGYDLKPLFQSHAVDLMARATQKQLLADPPPSRTALDNLAIDNTGHLAFALSGVISVTAIDQMQALPTPQVLNPAGE